MGSSCIGGQTRHGIAALDATTGLATAWDPDANGQVGALAVNGGTVYAGGNFIAIGGETRSRIAALDATAGLATTWDPSAEVGSHVNALAVSGGTVYAGDSFERVAGFPHAYIAGISATDVVDVPASSRAAELALSWLGSNPTSGSTRIGYTIPRSGHVRLSVHDVQGRLVARPVDELRPAGDQQAIWEPGSWGSGLYFVRLEYAGRSVTGRLVLIQ